MTNVLRNDGPEDTEFTSTVYRSRGVALFDEDAEPFERRKRTRVSARFDRTHWDAEYHHPFIEQRSVFAHSPDVVTPFNSETFGNAEKASGVFLAAMRKTHASRTKATKASLAEPANKQTTRYLYTKAELEAVPMHGKYKLLAAVDYGECGGVRVRAICEGGFCHGKIRIFGPGEWLKLGETMSCPKCDARQKRADLHAQMKRDVNTHHGKYRFVRFEDRGEDTEHFIRRVVGECLGQKCGGRIRSFAFRAWQEGQEGLTGCYQCTQIGRRKRAATNPATKLDAAANEMRQLEEAV